MSALLTRFKEFADGLDRMGDNPHKRILARGKEKDRSIVFAIQMDEDGTGFLELGYSYDDDPAFNTVHEAGEVPAFTLEWLAPDMGPEVLAAYVLYIDEGEVADSSYADVAELFAAVQAYGDPGEWRTKLRASISHYGGEDAEALRVAVRGLDFRDTQNLLQATAEIVRFICQKEWRGLAPK